MHSLIALELKCPSHNHYTKSRKPSMYLEWSFLKIVHHKHYSVKHYNCKYSVVGFDVVESRVTVFRACVLTEKRKIGREVTGGVVRGWSG